MLADTEYNLIEVEAKALQQHLNDPNWLTSIGLGEMNGAPCIFIYANNMSLARKAGIPNEWKGIPVKIKYLGTLRPA